MFEYKEKQFIYYKTDSQTREGTFATGCKKNYTYKLFNSLYNSKCLIKLDGNKSVIINKRMQEIIRYYPVKKILKQYPFRYCKIVFDKYNEIIENIGLQNDYKKWKSGINYKTNRKLKIGGNLHTELKEKFMIKCLNYRDVLFEDLLDINIDTYLQETEIIKLTIDKENELILGYNKMVDNIIENINKLTKWNDFIEFEGKNYGISCVSNNIHRENDCNGIMEFYKNEEHECKGCRDGVAFNGAYSCSCYTTKLNKCNICGYVKSITN